MGHKSRLAKRQVDGVDRAVEVMGDAAPVERRRVPGLDDCVLELGEADGWRACHVVDFHPLPKHALADIHVGGNAEQMVAVLDQVQHAAPLAVQFPETAKGPRGLLFAAPYILLRQSFLLQHLEDGRVSKAHALGDCSDLLAAPPLLAYLRADLRPRPLAAFVSRGVGLGLRSQDAVIVQPAAQGVDADADFSRQIDVAGLVLKVPPPNVAFPSVEKVPCRRQGRSFPFLTVSVGL